MSHSEGSQEAEVCGSPAQPLQAVRTAARLFAEVWDVPVVFSVAGAAGRDTGRPQIELVISAGE